MEILLLAVVLIVVVTPAIPVSIVVIPVRRGDPTEDEIEPDSRY